MCSYFLEVCITAPDSNWTSFALERLSSCFIEQINFQMLRCALLTCLLNVLWKASTLLFVRGKPCLSLSCTFHKEIGNKDASLHLLFRRPLSHPLYVFSKYDKKS